MALGSVPHGNIIGKTEVDGLVALVFANHFGATKKAFEEIGACYEIT